MTTITTQKPFFTCTNDEWRVFIRYRSCIQQQLCELLSSTRFSSKYEAEIEAVHMKTILELHGKTTWLMVKKPESVERRNIILITEYKGHYLNNKVLLEEQGVITKDDPVVVPSPCVHVRRLLNELRNFQHIKHTSDWVDVFSDEDFNKFNEGLLKDLRRSVNEELLEFEEDGYDVQTSILAMLRIVLEWLEE